MAAEGGRLLLVSPDLEVALVRKTLVRAIVRRDSDLVQLHISPAVTAFQLDPTVPSDIEDFSKPAVGKVTRLQLDAFDLERGLVDTILPVQDNRACRHRACRRRTILHADHLDLQRPGPGQRLKRRGHRHRAADGVAQAEHVVRAGVGALRLHNLQFTGLTHTFSVDPAV